MTFLLLIKLATLGSVAIMLLHWLNATTRERATTSALTLQLTCPRCRTGQELTAWRSTCQQCGLVLQNTIEEERCPKCGYGEFAATG